MDRGYAHRTSFAIFAALTTITSFPPPLSGAGSDPVEYTVTHKTYDVKCHIGRTHVDSPTAVNFTYPGGGGKGVPCIRATMGVQVKVEYMNLDNEDLTTFINVPPNAHVTGSCKSPQWMELSWKGVKGSSRSLKIHANPKISSSKEDDIHEYFVNQVSLRMEIDEEVFPRMLQPIGNLTALVENEKYFEVPLNKSFKCQEVKSKLKTKDPMGPITVVFKDVQFQTYISGSTFAEEIICKPTHGTDYVAIGIGCFLGATIVSALSSYAFCQWWRKRDRRS
ncbi:lysosome-associated membrane glycoprotein 1-like [Hetaerina americana]|uniref:lysosome-associated membrane glycoprotein 1-like n=1 Tax=Hetaerina americana TaxID=62018 RepID=UPI003A7F60C8